jgi:hypothetical protein
VRIPPAAHTYQSDVETVVTSLLWVLFFAVENKARDWVDGAKHRQVVAELLKLTGTVLAVFTLLGIFYFLYVTPRVQGHTPVVYTTARLETLLGEMTVYVCD